MIELAQMKKTCTTCEIAKDLSEFNKDSTKPDGHRSRCRVCRTNVERKGKKPVIATDIKAPEIKFREDAYKAALVQLANRHRAEFDSLISDNLKIVVNSKPSLTW